MCLDTIPVRRFSYCYGNCSKNLKRKKIYDNETNL